MTSRSLIKTRFIKFILICFFPFIIGCDKKNKETEIINVVFRFDDFSAISNTNFELKLIDAFQKNNWNLTISAIPFVNDGDEHDFSKQNLIALTNKKGDILKNGINAGIIDLALHGYSHQVQIEQNNEFAGLSYDLQLEILSKGKKLLENITNETITTFVPPWNSYDLNTLKALDYLKFSTISADRERVVNNNSSLIFLPYTCEIPKLKDAIREARENKGSLPTIVVMFHEYDFIEIDKKKGIITFPEFEKLLDYLKEQKDLKISSIGEIIKEHNHFTPQQYRWTSSIYMMNKFIPSFLHQNINITPYKNQYKIYIYTIIKFLLIYLSVLIISIIISRFLGRLAYDLSKILFKTGLLLSILTTIFLLIYVFHNLIFGQKGLILGIIATGTSMGLLKEFYSTKKNLKHHDEL